MLEGVVGASFWLPSGFVFLVVSRGVADFSRSVVVVDPARLAPNHVARLSALCGDHIESEVGIVARRE